MNQKLVILSGLVLVSLIVVLSFIVDVEAGPTGDVINVGRTSWVVKKCIDSDGGLDYYTRGSLNQKRGVRWTLRWDRCDSTEVLSENYCSEGGYRGTMTYTCPNGCKDGACKAIGHSATAPPAGAGVAS